MADRPKVVHGMAMDGFGKIQPLTEGYISKGGRNLTTRIVERPPAPAVLNQGNTENTQGSGAKTDKK
jgi:hypothetical protein